MRAAALLLVAVMLVPALLVLPTPAEAADLSYPGAEKIISSFDSASDDLTDHGYFDHANAGGNWTVTNGQPCLEGTGAKQISGEGALLFRFTPYATTNPLMFQHISFKYRSSETFLRASLSNPDNIYQVTIAPMETDGQWHTLELTMPAGWTDFRFGISIYTIPSGLPAQVSLDDFRAYSDPCSMRFSFFNEYTGLGVDSDLLIPEVWHDGSWDRIWRNEITIAQGELVAYRVTDYYGQVLTASPSFVLNGPTFYIDQPVKLVKVHIVKPAYWDASYPPEWTVSYLPTGRELKTTGWELEVIAGWYRLSWVKQVVGQQPATVANTTPAQSDTPSDIYVETGTADFDISGNATTHQGYTILGLTLSMSPTMSSTSGGNAGIILGGDLISWSGLQATFTQVADAFIRSAEYKMIMIVGCLFTLAGIVAWLNSAKKKLQGGGPQ